MKNTLRKNALATTALGVMLAVPGVATAQETCLQVLGTVSAHTLDAQTDGQVNALIITAGSAEEGAACIESLDELTAMLGDEAAIAEGLTAIEPSASAEGGDGADVPGDADPEAAEAQPEGDEAVVPEEGQAADADAAAETEEEMAADAEAPADEPLGNAGEMLAGLTAGEIEGMDVLSPEGEDIGTVEFLAVDAEGRVNVVMSLDDGVLGIGDSERVVAIDQFDYNAEEESLVLVQLSEEWLETLPEFDTDTPGYIEIEDDAYVLGN